MGRDFTILEHTADAGIEARGATLEDAFAAAARGMYAIIAGPGHVKASAKRTIEIAAPDRERLLVRWLEELLFLTETEALVFGRFDVAIEGDRALHGRVWGERFAPGRHGGGIEVKAVTRHQLEVHEGSDGFRVRVYFDV